ncbi:MAG: transketolase C-terminal domain-containing protein, partial [Candidatus Omnitrophota bacterium]
MAALMKQRVVHVFTHDSIFVGEDGPTHHGAFDIAYLRQIPGMCLLAPKDGSELAQMMTFALSYDKGPVAIRFPRAAASFEVDRLSIRLQSPAIEEGRAEVIGSGGDVLLVAYGSMVRCACRAAQLLEKESLQTTVINARFAKPLDEKTILEHLSGKRLVVTLEEGTLCGGFGSAVLELAAGAAYKKSDRPLIKTLGLPDCFVTHGRREFLLELVGLTPEAVRNSVVAHLNSAQALSAQDSSAIARLMRARAGSSKLSNKVAS